MMKEVSREEFIDLVRLEREAALQKMVLMVDGILKAAVPELLMIPEHRSHYDTHWFVSNETEMKEYIPCIYKHKEVNYVICPASHEQIPTRPLPKNFRREPDGTSLSYLGHASDVPCFKITTKTKVRCYAIKNGKCYVDEHLVGRCKHKR